MNIQDEDPAIELSHVFKSYARPVLKDISLKIHRGSVVGYIGANGAGKSTTVKILTGLITDFGGSVKLLGRDFRENTLELKKKIGYIPENATLYEMLTPMEYLHFIGGLYEMEEQVVEERSCKMLTVFGMQDSIYQRMDGFSKGMKQKVLIVSALIHDPEIIFMDEPLTGLDANAVILLKEVISGLKQQAKTILYCSHIMDVVEKISDRIILIKDGQIMADGTMETLRAQAQSQSLEEIFARLTERGATHQQGSDFMSAFKTKDVQ